MYVYIYKNDQDGQNSTHAHLHVYIQIAQSHQSISHTTIHNFGSVPLLENEIGDMRKCVNACKTQLCLQVLDVLECTKCSTSTHPRMVRYVHPIEIWVTLGITCYDFDWNFSVCVFRYRQPHFFLSGIDRWKPKNWQNLNK